MEQVLRTVSALNDAGFSGLLGVAMHKPNLTASMADITMYETLVRPHDVTHVPALQSITEVADKLKKSEGVREIKRLRQIAAGQRSHENPHGEKRKRSEEMNDQEEPPVAEAEDSGSGKRLKTDDEMDDGTPSQDADVSRSLDESSTQSARAGASIPAPPAKISVSKAIPEVRGHTSYLTFATLLPPMPPAPPEDAPSQGLLSSFNCSKTIDVHCY
jgi:tRNA (adenine57-N1/adenine58-N1)-methyltransferase